LEAPSSRHVDLAEPRRPLLHLLAGASPASLARILSRRGALSPRSYMQVAIIFASALLRWPGCMVEALRVARRVEDVSFDPPPVFIVGHWRSGTTLLHNLISRDPGFCFPTIVDVLRPYDFYPNPFDFISRGVLLRFLPPTRPMDLVRLDPESPQEEELALATMGAPSFFNCFNFPKHMTEVFADEVLFASGNDDSLRLWREALTYYLAKLAALNPGRQLLLKNPAHSARIPQLLALFPGAKFIHIHRDPSAVFQSTRRLYHSMLPLVALQDYRPADVDGHIVWAYREVMNRLLDSLAELPPGRAIAVRYDELVADPVSTVKRIYCDLNLGDFERVKYVMETYADEHLQSMSPVPTLDHETASRLALNWGPIYTRLGYPSLAPMQRAPTS
jgi:omega-hydroxy-beta-dihydromenaquinone-9 sulfotransferase